jgi:hypothetical protein
MLTDFSESMNEVEKGSLDLDIGKTNGLIHTTITVIRG